MEEQERMSPTSVFLCTPWKMTEEELSRVMQEVYQIYSKSGKFNNTALYTMGPKGLKDALKDIVDEFDLRYREEAPDWDLQKQGKKPMSDSLLRCVKRCEYIIYIDNGDSKNDWMKGLLKKIAMNEKLKMLTKEIGDGKES